MKMKNHAVTMAAFPVSAFSYVAYRATYHSPHRPRGSATLPMGATLQERRKLFRDAKRRLVHGVPVGVLIQYVTMKLRTMGEVYDERH